MPEFALGRGAAAWLRIGNSSIRHIHVVLTDPIYYEKSNRWSVLIVNLTSERNRSGDLQFDPACELTKEDDPLITKDCFVLYRKADIISVKQLEAWIMRDEAEIQSMRDEALNKICEGLKASKLKREGYLRFYLLAQHMHAAD